MLNIPPAAVERVVERRLRSYGSIRSMIESDVIQMAGLRRDAVDDLTAALRLDDPETRSQVGQAIRFGVLAGPARGRGTYDDVADLAVQALLGAEDDA